MTNHTTLYMYSQSGTGGFSCYSNSKRAISELYVIINIRRTMFRWLWHINWYLISRWCSIIYL